MERMIENIESIEVEADKILNEAKDKAGSIIREGEEKAKAILNSDLPVEDARAECEKNIIAKAQEDAEKMVEEAKQSAAKVKERAAKKEKSAVDLIIDAVIGS